MTSRSTATLADPTDGRAECERCSVHVVLKLDDAPEVTGAKVRAFIAAHDHAGVTVRTPSPRAVVIDRTPLRCAWCGKRCKWGAFDADGEPLCSKCAAAGERRTGEAAE